METMSVFTYLDHVAVNGGVRVPRTTVVSPLPRDGASGDGTASAAQQRVNAEDTAGW